MRVCLFRRRSATRCFDWRSHPRSITRFGRRKQACSDDEQPWVRGIDRRETAVFRCPAEPLIRRNENGNTSDLSQSERNRQLDGVKSSKSSLHSIAGEQIARLAVMPLVDRWPDPDAPLRHIGTQAAPCQFPASGVEFAVRILIANTDSISTSDRRDMIVFDPRTATNRSTYCEPSSW